MRLLVSKRQRELLRRSVTPAKDFPDLFGCLQKTEQIYDTDLCRMDLSPESVSLLEYTLKDYIKTISESEWNESIESVDLGADKSKWVRCSLCGTPNRYKCHIKNVYTKEEINVGSECLKMFGGLAVHVGAVDLEQLQSQGRAEKRRAEINVVFPGISDKIRNGSIKIADSPFALPATLFADAKATLEMLRKHYEAYVKGSKGESVFAEIESLFKYFAQLESEVDDFNLYARQDKLSCPLEILRWLESKNEDGLIETIRSNNGRIDEKVVAKIYEPNWLNTFMPELRTLISADELTLEKIDGGQMIFSLAYKLKIGRQRREEAYNIKLYCASKDFMLKFGTNLLDRTPIDLSTLSVLLFIDASDLDETGINGLVDTVFASNGGYSLEFVSSKEAYVYALKGNGDWVRRTKIDPSVTYEALLRNLLGYETADVGEKIMSIVKGFKRWQTKEEVIELNQMNKRN